jgi:hypothetical protein
MSRGPSKALGYPVFCLRNLQAGYDIDDLQADDQRHFIKRLRHLSKMEWSAVMSAPRHGAGKENISRAALRVAVPPSIDRDAVLWALRYSQRKAMVGWRKGDVFHVIWIDHNFSVYKH